VYAATIATNSDVFDLRTIIEHTANTITDKQTVKSLYFKVSTYDRMRTGTRSAMLPMMAIIVLARSSRYGLILFKTCSILKRRSPVRD
jgi:hypothetical protein